MVWKEMPKKIINTHAHLNENVSRALDFTQNSTDDKKTGVRNHGHWHLAGQAGTFHFRRIC